MRSGSFQENSLGWQIQLLQQRFDQWWELQLQQAADSLARFPSLSWLDSQLLQEGAKIAFWVLVALLGLGAVWQVWRLLRTYWYRWQQEQRQGSLKKTEQPSSVASWLAQSSDYQRQGNYRNACLCLYQAMLQLLSDRGVIPQLNSRTDGEYLRLIAELPQPEPYQTLLLTHQRLCFSNIEASPSLLEACQQAYKRIEAR